MTDWLSNPLQTIINVFESMISMFTQVVDFMSFKIPFGRLMDFIPNWAKEIASWIYPFWDLIPTEDITIFQLMLTGGVLIFLTLTIVKWVIGIIQ